ncbi:3-mercaptopyruvate sulfurtransferase [Hyphococcus flavus]|uniref:3-mercaptopyruvate sulfurtransferase n=1 Tax=Hyphococcus flavus TaxID=1866326 RepID=A0AAE9ZEG5_9PROT|nr:3-mercaptopyruvate sulfurtransferase [Hyphococcus flavus]WDI31127.1 3-mercaptopyruvate sulfurtransferase [Hyphococcus flavus]
MNSFGPLVSTDWLSENLGQKDLKIIDGSWRMPGQGEAIDKYRKQHIPGAVFFDIDAISDYSTDLPHMLPPSKQFEAAVGALGISDKDNIVVYDEKGLFSAARVWWTFRAMGHENIAVLDGGLPKWTREGHPLTADAINISPVNYNAVPIPKLSASHADVRKAINAKSACIIDARPAERFEGHAPEPRPGLRSGHMPGAVNIPHDRLLTETGVFRTPDEIRDIFANAGVESQKPVITSCGSGVTASILALALELIGCGAYAVYDGSWAEWGDERNDSATFPVVSDAKK